MHTALSNVLAVGGLAMIQAGLVALPRAASLGSLQRLRSPGWALMFPGMLVAGTVGVLALPATATGLAVLASFATPVLAGIAVVAVVQARRRLLIVPLALLFATTLAGWPGQLAASLVTALGCMTLGAGLVRLTPAPWLTLGILGMCAVDVLLLAAGIGQPAAALLSDASNGSALPTLHDAQLGSISIDYPDLILAAVVGAIFAGRAVQRRAAALLATLAGGYAALLLIADMVPATVPLALALVVVELGPSLARVVKARVARAPLARRAGTPPARIRSLSRQEVPRAA